ncbi:MAG: patatin-like phospholipase family protein [Syntrophales bacterium]|nr:patatin-like phospholipase family protein [Syntrophales bacterium]
MKRVGSLLLFFAAALMVSCGATTVQPQSFDYILNRPELPKIALVLSGGSARGFAHVGVIRALEQGHVPIDMVVGTSVGSLIGAIYASNLNSFDLEWTAFTLEKEDLLDYGLLTTLTGMGTVKGDKLENFINSKIAVKNIEEMKLPYAAIATDLNRGTRVILQKGSIAKAVHASSAIPGVFQPVKYQDRLLIDGGVVDNMPVSVAREMGADIVIAVDIGKNVTNFNITNTLDVILQSVYIMFNENVACKKKDVDILITPDLEKMGMFDFTCKKQVMQAGIDAAQKAMPEIISKIDRWIQGKGRKG